MGKVQEIDEKVTNLFNREGCSASRGWNAIIEDRGKNHELS